MLIDDFKKYFNLDNMDLSYGNKPTIELSNYDYWNKTRVAYLNGFDASGKTMTLHFIENYLTFLDLTICQILITSMKFYSS